MSVFSPLFIRQLAVLIFLSFTLTNNAISLESSERESIAVFASDNDLNVGSHIQWLEDPDGIISFAEVRQLDNNRFTPSDGHTFSKGYTSVSYWLRFELDFKEGSLNKNWLLEIPFPVLDYVSLYSPNANGSYEINQTGDRLPFKQRDMDLTNFVFFLDPLPQKNVYFLHVRTQDSLQVPLTLWQQEAYPKHNAIVAGWQGVYFGCMFVMILYNLFIYISIRDTTYLYYICYITFCTAFQAGIQGYSFEYLWPDNTWWANVNIPFFAGVALFSATLFSRNVLDTKSLTPTLDKILISISCFLFCTLPIMLLADYGFGVVFTVIVSFIFFNVVFFTAIICIMKGSRTAKMFTAAWSLFLVSGSISMLAFTGILPPDFFNMHAMQIGSAIEVVLLSMVLADRINYLEQEKAELEAESKRVLAQANKHLEDSNKLKGEFIATISHEVRTPMNGVLGSAQLLADTALNSRQANYVNTINGSAQGLLDILNNILDYSKIEAGKLDFEHVEFDLEKVVDECASLFAAQSEQSGVDFFVCIHKGSPSRIIGDPVRFKQILVSLISNAFKFTNEGQVIVHVKMQSGANSHLLLVEIEDSGIGLSEEQKDIIFQPFMQIDSTTARKFGGTGLGLAICKKLTHLMGGNIGVRSTLGQGSTFWFNSLIDVAKEGRDIKVHSGAKAYVLLNNKRQESLLKSQLKDWGLLLNNEVTEDSNTVIFTDESNLSAIEPCLQTDNIIVVGNCLTKHKNIRSPITTSKLYAALSSGPYLPENLISISPKSATSNIFPQLKVLAVDDNSVNRMVINGLLRKFEISADIAKSGEEAVRLASNLSSSYDLILMDIEMPGKDGYDATRDIRSFEKKQGLEPKPIVAISAHAVKEYKGKALDSGMNDFLSKPVDQDVLYKILEGISLTKQAEI